jgi:aldehyde dehydrogenase (NAD+)
MTGKSIEDAKSEVDLAIQRLFHWGAYADKYGGTVQVQGNLVQKF